jgi:hypothetical protein
MFALVKMTKLGFSPQMLLSPQLVRGLASIHQPEALGPRPLALSDWEGAPAST